MSKTILTAAAALLTAAATHAGEWTYDPPNSRITHADTRWTLRVTADGTGLTVTGVAAEPRAPDTSPSDFFANLPAPVLLPLDDAVSGGAFRITAIGSMAFSCCHRLADVTIPATVTSIGTQPFDLCGRLTNITVAADNPAYRSADGVLFSKDGELIQFPPGKSSCDIPDGTTRIGDHMFMHHFKLTSVTIPDSVTSIGNYAFAFCGGLTAMTIPSGVTEIGWDAFASCHGITGISVAEANPAYRSIDGVVFSKDGKQLALYPAGKTGAYDIPPGTATIKAGVFAHCHDLPNVTIPASVTNIGDSTFYVSRPLTNITVAADNPAYRSTGGVLFNKSGSLLIQYPYEKAGAYAIPAGTTAIGDSAFSACHRLTGVTIPAGVTSIGGNAFTNCKGLTDLTIPASVTRFGSHTFGHCDGLTNVTFEGECPAITGHDKDEVFYGFTTNATLYVRNAHAANWSKNVTGSLADGTAVWKGRPVRVLPPAGE